KRRRSGAAFSSCRCRSSSFCNGRYAHGRTAGAHRIALDPRARTACTLRPRAGSRRWCRWTSSGARLMETAGLWMLAAVAALTPATGLASWMLVIGVALVSGLLGVMFGVVAPSLLTGVQSRILG